jgi:hypothetical protein
MATSTGTMTSGRAPSRDERWARSVSAIAMAAAVSANSPHEPAAFHAWASSTFHAGEFG